MSVASNQYASRVFSEHPVASWSLDDEVYYISLITEAQRSLENWSELVNATYFDYLPAPDNPFPDGPFPDSIFTELVATDYQDPAEAYSANLFFLDDLNQTMNSLALNIYVYTDGSAEWYEFGYRYLDPLTSSWIEDVQRFEDTRFSTWIRFGATFNPPNKNAPAQVVFRAKFTTGTNASVVLNGLSIGQWSESVSKNSLGVIPQPVPQHIEDMIGEANAVSIQAYGISEDDGYIITENNRLLATNAGIPMVFGSNNVTRLNPSGTLPSIIMPSKGVLNNSGKFNTYTVEMWLRIENNSAETRRIWGPLTNDFGLYVKRGYLSLVIGNSIGSYFIAEWYRPMLLHVVIRENAASVMINGEEVIAITYQTSELTLPSINEDWMGFYCHEDMPIFELDCVSIFPYVVPAQVAKRRFVWGQGVESPETINSAYEGTVAYIDYPFAEYNANLAYPDQGRWDAGYFENLEATRRSLSVPAYSLPTIELGEKTLQNLYDDNYIIQEENHAKFISFRPNETWTDPAYYLFPTLNTLTDVVRGIWAVFETYDEFATEPSPLVHFVNTLNGDRFEINITGTTVEYVLIRNGISQIIRSLEVVVDYHFIVGIHLPRLFASTGINIGEFFGNPSAIQMYVGGDGTNTFSGLIYRVGFSNQTNLDEIEVHFDSDGIAVPDDGDLLNVHLGSYTLIPTEDYNRFFLDIGVSSYWEEYYPLSLFAGFSETQFGRAIYDVDFLQYNIAYPTTTTLVENEIIGEGWTYQELATEYNYPFVKNYETLDNALITGYDNYQDLMDNVVTEIDYDFSNSSVRTFVTFQRISDGANKPIGDYTIEQALPASNVLDVPTYQNVFSTKFEIKDQAIIYPPKNFSVDDTAMVLHLSVNVHGILTNPLNIRKMSIASEVFKSNGFTEIGTRFGNKLIPYNKVGLYFDYTKKNPYSIYRDSNPYLYLTKYSGIESLGQREFNVERGISLPINEQSAQNQSISALQVWMKYSDDNFPQIATPLFSLDAAALDIEFDVIADSSTRRGKIFAKNVATGQEYLSLTFYQDGVQVINPYIEKDKWTVIGINFGRPIDFSNYVGAVNLYQSAIFNDIAYYKATSLQESQSIIYRRWDNIDGNPPVSPLEWIYWRGQNPGPYGLWDNVLKLAETGIYGVNPENLFKAYSGTNRQVVDDGTELVVTQDSAILFASEMIDVPNGVNTPRVLVTNSPEWATYIQKPV